MPIEERIKEERSELKHNVESMQKKKTTHGR
jgi:hypothetical protein